MPVRYEIDNVRSLVLTAVTGTVTAADMRAYHATMIADPAFSPRFDSLMEFHDDSVFDGSGEDIEALSQSAPFDPQARRVYVVANDLHFGLSRMAQEYADIVGGQATIFRDRAAALAWLERGAPEPLP